MSKEQSLYIKKNKQKKISIICIQLFITFSFLVIWQVLSDKKIINPFIFSSPTRVYNTIIDLAINGKLFKNIFVTCWEVILTFGLGFVISLLLALLFYFSNYLYLVADPFITMLNSLPKVAIGPMIIIIFGANTKSIIIMALLISLVVSMITIYTGFIKINNNGILLFKSMNANKFQILRYLILPGSLNSIIASSKLNISLSFIGVIMGEFLVSKSGIGYLIIYGTQVFNLDLVISGVFILVVISYLFYKPISILENKYSA